MSKTKILGPPIGYVDMLDLAIQKKVEEDAKKPVTKNPLRPSSLGKCAREKAFEYMEYKGYALYEKEPMSPEGYRIFSLGHAVEYDLLKQFGLVEALQVKYKQQSLTFYPLHDGSLVEGSVDVVFISPKWKCIADVKSKGDKFSSYRSSKWDEDSEKLERMKTVTKITDTSFWVEELEAFLEELNDPFFAANFKQLNGYAVNQFITERGIDHAAIIQYNKADSRLREVRFKPSMALFEKLKEVDQRIAKVIDETKNPEEIEKTFNLGSIKCAFCAYKKHCWDVDTAKPFFQTLPPKFWPKDLNRLDEDLGRELEELFKEFEQAVEESNKSYLIEEKITKLMVENELRKVRLSNGNIYDMRVYKSPRERLALKRSK